jgi:hypothetical protein
MQAKHRNQPVIRFVGAVTLLALGGCSSDSDGEQASTGALTCGKPSCCTPLVYDPSRVFVSQTSDGSGVSIGMVLELSNPPSDYWEVNVDVTLPSGKTIPCGSAISPPPSYKHVTIGCPVTPLDSLPACGSTLALELRTRSSTYADGNGSQALCAGTDGQRLKLAVPVSCPECAGTVANFSSCSVLGQTCGSWSMSYGGGGGTSSVQLPCYCQWNDGADRLAWSCAVP